jgi:DNA-directed RNA polymerase specialized sigma24 family protein
LAARLFRTVVQETTKQHRLFRTVVQETTNKSVRQGPSKRGQAEMNPVLKQKQMEHSTRVKLSIAACALVMAASTADAGANINPAPQATQVEAEVLTKIRAYCIRSWQNAGIARQEWEDCTQDVFQRLLENLDASEVKVAITNRDSTERRELNRSIWATAQRRRRAVRHSSIVDDNAQETAIDPWPERMQALDQVRSAISDPEANLNGTQKEIVNRWSQGESIAAIASTLELSAARVSDEKYKAISKIRKYLGVTA